MCNKARQDRERERDGTWSNRVLFLQQVGLSHGAVLGLGQRVVLEATCLQVAGQPLALPRQHSSPGSHERDTRVAVATHLTLHVLHVGSHKATTTVRHTARALQLNGQPFVVLAQLYMRQVSAESPRSEHPRVTH